MRRREAEPSPEEKPDVDDIEDRYEAVVRWRRRDHDFEGGDYSRRHEWAFDGGVMVPASASPQIVPLPLSSADAVDPEEAVVAAASSCHMLVFLSLAARRGFVVDAYTDDAVGFMGRTPSGRTGFTRIELRPDIRFANGRAPGPEELGALHRAAHHGCYIANSLTCEVVVGSAGADRPGVEKP